MNMGSLERQLMDSFKDMDVKEKEKEQKDHVSFTLPQDEDGAIDVAGTPGGAYATYLDMEGSAKNEAELIIRYRTMSLFPETEIAIDDIVNDAVVADRTITHIKASLAGSMR